uniref:Uncharacterized protein n=1 Tax=Glossina pallidipes TaxID=7398 RepID=A0A1A9ZM43_GLOPL
MVVKKYNHWEDIIFIVYFGNGMVRSNSLRHNIQILLHAVVCWNYIRKHKGKPVQRRNCYMFGYGGRARHIKPKCAEKLRTANCSDSSNVRHADCNENHTSMDSTCPNCALCLQIRDKLNNKNCAQRPKSQNNSSSRGSLSSNMTRRFQSCIMKLVSTFYETQSIGTDVTETIGVDIRNAKGNSTRVINAYFLGGFCSDELERHDKRNLLGGRIVTLIRKSLIFCEVAPIKTNAIEKIGGYCSAKITRKFNRGLLKMMSQNGDFVVSVELA